jgi:hypothetical protein
MFSDVPELLVGKSMGCISTDWNEQEQVKYDEKVTTAGKFCVHGD